MSEPESTSSQTTPMLNTLLAKQPNEGPSQFQQTPQHPQQGGQQQPLTNGERYPGQSGNVQGQPPSEGSSGMAPPNPQQQGPGMPPHLPPGMPHPGMHQMPPGMPPHMVGYPPGYPHPYYAQQMQMRGMPPHPSMYGGGVMGHPHPGQFPPHYGSGMMMRPQQPPQQQGDLVKMPQGPNPLEWANAQKIKEEENGESSRQGQSQQAAPQQQSSQQQPQWHGQPGAMGMHPGMGPHPGQPQPQSSTQSQQPPAPPTAAQQAAAGTNSKKAGIVDQLVGPITAANPARVMPERKHFFERLVHFCEQHGDPITVVPQVSKQNVDLHRLYIAVRNRGGFEQVTREKAWKSICPEANPEISESSAAGYQLRKHYQKHLLLLECVETGKNPDDAIAFADKLKKKRAKGEKDRDGQNDAASTSASTPGPHTPARLGSPNSLNPQLQPTTSAHPAPPPVVTTDSGVVIGWTNRNEGNVSMAQGRVAATATWYPLNSPQTSSNFLSIPGTYSTGNSPRTSPIPGSSPIPPYNVYKPSTSPINPTSYNATQLPYSTNQKPEIPSGNPGITSNFSCKGDKSSISGGASTSQSMSYGQYAVNYYHQHNMQREALLRARGPSGYYPNQGGGDWRLYQYPYGVPPGLPQPPHGYPPHGYPMAPGHAGYYHPDGRSIHPGWPGYPHGVQPPMQPQMPPQHPQQRIPIPPQHIQQQQQSNPSNETPQIDLQQPQSAQSLPSQVHTGPGTPSHASQATTPAPPATPGQPGTPASMTGNALQVEGGSRAPSTGPPPPSATPDSASRLSAGADERPPSQTTTTSTVQPQPQPQPPPLQPQQPPNVSHPPQQGAASPYYPPHYPQRPGVPGPQMRPPGGYPGYPYNIGPQGQYIQPGYWRGQQPGGGYVPSSAPQAGPSVPPSVQPVQPPTASASPAQRFYPRQIPPSNQGAPSPNQQPRNQVPTASAYQQQSSRPQISSSGTPVSVPAPSRYAEQAAAQQQQQQQQPQPTMVTAIPQPAFPPDSVEAAQMSTRKRKRPSTKDLIGVTPRRVLMALRSGLETEAVWAMNALSISLAEDVNSVRSHEWINLFTPLIEHMTAALSILWPNSFALSCPAKFKCRDSELTEEEDFGEDLLKNGLSEILGKDLVGKRHHEDKKQANYTMITRTGRAVKFEKASIPIDLRRINSGHEPEKLLEEPQLNLSIDGDKVSVGMLAARIAASFKTLIDYGQRSKGFLFSRPSTSFTHPNHHPVVIAEKKCKMEIDEEEKQCPIFYRQPTKLEQLDGPIDFEATVPRRTAIVIPEVVLGNVAARALCASNALRSLSFCQNLESQITSNRTLLLLISHFLRLETEERPFKRTPPMTKFDPEMPMISEIESIAEQQRKAVALLDEENEEHCIKLETAAQLREDALTILCHLSGSLILYDLPGGISYRILDGLLHWLTTPLPCATDMIGDSGISPRNYALEILCKLSVVESNVDLLCATGPWPRLERLVVVLAKLINMNEDTHIREFGIVILNAIVSISPELCWVAAHRSPAIEHLISFIETADSNMHQVMQQHGMNALRSDPELMGTSVGMLRRSASLLRQLSRANGSHKLFARHQNRLLQFTMSQLMDSRVAGMVADTLYTVQTALSNDEEIAKKDEMAKMDEREKEGEKEMKREGEETQGISEETMDTSISEMVNGEGHADKSITSNHTEDTRDSSIIPQQNGTKRTENGREGSGSESGGSPRLENINQVKGQQTTSSTTGASNTKTTTTSTRNVPNGIHPRENGGMTAVA